MERTAAEHGREIDPEHFGVLIPYAMTTTPDALLAAVAARRPAVAAAGDLVPLGWRALAQHIGRFVDVGFSKFVVVPTEEPSGDDAWTAHLEAAAEALLPLET